MPRVLIVEDDADVSALVASVLRKAGYDVLTAADGTTGLELIRNEQIGRAHV